MTESDILFGIYSGILLGIVRAHACPAVSGSLDRTRVHSVPGSCIRRLRGEGRRGEERGEERRGEERPAPLLKSRDHRLADAEKTMNQVAGWAVCQPIAAMPPPIRPVRRNIEPANFYAFSFANQETKPAHFKPHISLVSGGSKWGNLKPLHPTRESGSLSANCNLQQYGAVEIG